MRSKDTTNTVSVAKTKFRILARVVKLKFSPTKAPWLEHIICIYANICDRNRFPNNIEKYY